MAKHPKLEGKECFGVDLRIVDVPQKLDLEYIIEFYEKWKGSEPFFTSYFNTLAGTDELRRQIERGMSQEEIRASWQQGLENYGKMKLKYLLYQE